VQQVVHLLIVGESQEGKSTTARALLHARARSEDARA
jgi:ABC-type oligopeptide transport system ATPase subunit